MTGQQFAKFIRSQTKTNSQTYPDARLLDDANIALADLVESVQEINEDYFGMLAYRNLVANQREYSLPEYLLQNIKYLEIDVKGDGDHVHADEIQLVQYGQSTDEKEIQKRFSLSKPRFEIFRQSLWVYTGQAIKAVLNGLKLYYIRYPDEITIERLTDNLTDLSNDLVHPRSSGIPRPLHKVWATKVIVLYKQSKEKPITLSQTEQVVDQTLAEKVKTLSGINLDRNFQAEMPRNTGEKY